MVLFFIALAILVRFAYYRMQPLSPNLDNLKNRGEEA
jgi:hypothetical protein